jgi:hypothetical protein
MMRGARAAVNESNSMDAMVLTGQMLAQALALFLTPVMLGALAAALGKLLWFRALAGVRWWALAWPAMLVCSAVLLAALVLLGRDGRMAAYAAMVAGCAITLWWRGFGPGRPHRP